MTGIVVKLARAHGDKAKEQTTRVSGVVTRDGRPVAAGGRVSCWRKRGKEGDPVNVTMHRGRTVPVQGFELAWSRVGSDGTYLMPELKPGQPSSQWYFVYEEPGQAPAVAGPVAITAKDRDVKIDIAASAGGAIEGRVENVPAAMAGQIYVIAFNDGVLRRETLASADGSFRLEKLTPGRYGLKAGHDAYVDPHVPRAPAGGSLDPSFWEKVAKPWQGAVEVKVEPGRTTGGAVIDFRAGADRRVVARKRQQSEMK